MEYLDQADYAAFKRRVLKLIGVDLGQYKSQQMERRLRGMLERTGAGSLAAYARVLEHDPLELKKFQDFFTINVSEFFRNPEKFDELEKRILPGLLVHSPKLNIWSAGCSNGAEIYSVVMILDKMTPGRVHRFLATDIDATVIEKAKAGVYLAQDVRNVPRACLARYFTKQRDKYVISDGIKSRVEFRVHNLLADSFEKGFDLIICRNVVIYFTEQAKDQLYRNFRESLKEHGVLFVGGTETILNAASVGLASASPFFYRRLPVGKELRA
ncbi:MAG: protein-glutamate O-methyltransferase CheR [Firmicutes bacterium]|jgi:chemotaxis protein methyltransferase CheR|nr:protein-glutamate O-methyltransferase CheR [Bacillota bacterium]